MIVVHCIERLCQSLIWHCYPEPSPPLSLPQLRLNQVHLQGVFICRYVCTACWTAQDLHLHLDQGYGMVGGYLRGPFSVDWPYWPGRASVLESVGVRGQCWVDIM